MSWQVFYKRNAHATVRLFCFHYAGGSASAFRNWGKHLPSSVELIGVQLPGREGRFREPFVTRFDDLIETLAEVLTPYLDKPYAVFGHSLGTLISFEWIRQLERCGRRRPLLFFASGRQAPQFPSTDPPISSLPEEEFIRELLKEYEDNLGSLLEKRELREAFIPQLRADFELSESYEYRRGAKLGCPIIAYAGKNETKIGERELTGWREHTIGRFTAGRFPDAHFFIHSQEDLVLQEIRRELSSEIELSEKAAASYFH